MKTKYAPGDSFKDSSDDYWTAGINAASSESSDGVWAHKIECYGKTEAEAIKLRDQLLSAILDAEGDGGAVGGKYTDAQIEAMVALHRDHSLHTAAVPPDVSRVTADMFSYLLASRKHPARSGVVSDEGVQRAIVAAESYSSATRIGWEAMRSAIDAAIQGERHER